MSTTSEKQAATLEAIERTNIANFVDILSRRLHRFTYELDIKGKPPTFPTAALEKAGIDVSAMEAEAAERQQAYVKAVQDARSKLPPPTGARAKYVRERFLRANPAASYLRPHSSQVLRFPGGPHQLPPDYKLVRIPHYLPPYYNPDPIISGPIIEYGDEFGNNFVPIACSSHGNGSGWFDDNDQVETVIVSWNFLFTPAITSNWTFSAFLWTVGDYMIYANDTFWTSKEASGQVYFTMQQGPLSSAAGPVVAGGPSANNYSVGVVAEGAFTTEFDEGNDNIHISGTLDTGDVVSYDTAGCDGPIEAGTETLVVVSVMLETDAQGAGSVAELNFNGPGQGVGCFALRITPD